MLREDDRGRRPLEPGTDVKGPARRAGPTPPAAGAPSSRTDEIARAPTEEGRADDAPADDATDTPDDAPGTLAKVGVTVRRHPIWTAVGLVLFAAAVAGGVLWYLAARHWEATDDAFVDARSFSVAPKVMGYLVDVPVTDNQHVAAGDLIARVDDRDYRVAVQQAEAQLAAAVANLRSADAQIASGKAQVEEARAQVRQTEATLAFATDENARAAELVQKGAGTLQRAQQTNSQQREGEANLARSNAALNAAERQVAVQEAQRASQEASVAQAQAQVDTAKLNLSFTEVVAAQPGRVVRLTGAKGQLAQAGQALATFVPDALGVTANFKETQLTDMRPGQAVEMTIDAYPARKLTGRVDSVQAGSGTAFSLLPAQNATGNYVKVVQRVPVKLVFDGVPDDVTIGPGMSVVPRVRVR